MGVVVLIFTLLPPPAAACSLIACLNHGINVAGTFEVVVKHDGKPLRGVGVTIKVFTDSPFEVYSSTTDVGGVAHIKLPPGDYELTVEYLGVGAGYQCFHVDRGWSWRAKHVLSYTWGDSAPSTRSVAGSVLDSQPGTGGTPIWNISHPLDVPITGARLRLQNAITGDLFNTMSDARGAFDFGAVPDGTYALHIEGGVGRDYNPTDEVVKVDQVSKRRTLDFRWQDSSCGSSLHLKLPSPDSSSTRRGSQ
jgi:hypothetical protein